MTTVAPPALVNGAARIALPFGLFSVLGWRSGGRWESGVLYERLICDPVGAIGPADCDPSNMIGLPKDLARNGQGDGEADPFTVYGHFNCSPVGWTPESAQARATEHLTAREEARVEQAFWTGDLGNTPNLADEATDLTGGSVVPLAQGLGLLEAIIGQQYGALGVIHLPRAVALQALGEHLLETKGGRLQTMLGTPVVAGAGYPGSGPDGSSIPGKPWIYASAALFGYRSDVFTSSNRAGDLLDRASNDLYAVAERTYLLGFDDCTTAAVQIDPRACCPIDGGAGDPGTQTTLALTIGSVPGSPVTVGTDVTVEVHSNIAPTDEVFLYASRDGGAWINLGEMTEVATTEFVFNQTTTATGSIRLYARSGAAVSPAIVLEIT